MLPNGSLGSFTARGDCTRQHRSRPEAHPRGVFGVVARGNMASMPGTYAEKLGAPAHRSFFREALSARAKREAVHEYLIDQANLRGFFGAFSDRSELGEIDQALAIEDIVVGLLQPHAPAEARVVKLVVRILQSAPIDARRLLFRARRERADSILAWIIELVPVEEQRGAIVEFQTELRARPPRETRRPAVRCDPRRLVPRKAALP